MLLHVSEAQFRHVKVKFLHFRALHNSSTSCMQVGKGRMVSCHIRIVRQQYNSLGSSGLLLFKLLGDVLIFAF